MTDAISCGGARRAYDVIQASLVDTWAATAAGRLHADRELAVHEGGVRRVRRSPHGRRAADDHALGVRRPAARVAGAGCVCRARSRRVNAPGHHSLRPRRDVSAEEAAIHRGRGRAAARCQQRTGLLNPLCAGPPPPTRCRGSGRDAAHGDERGGLPPSDPGERSPAVPRRRTRSTNRPRPTTARSSFTRRGCATRCRWRSAAACCSATV